MTKNRLAASVAALALFLPSAARAQAQYVAQGDSPEWLKDRRYNEGPGVREGDLELHPGIAGEVGYDSNWFLRSSSNGGFVNSGPSTPPVPALVFRITPSLYLSTLGPQRTEGDVAPQPPSIRFRAGINATYREFIGVSSDSVASQPQNDISKQQNVGGSADARLEIAPERPLGAALFASFGRTILPNAGTANPNFSFNRDDVGAGGELIVVPGSGTLDWHFGYQFHDTLFEQSDGVPYDNTSNQLYTRGRWKFRPRTSLIYDASLGFINYTNGTEALQAGLVNSTPIRARIGLNGLITDRFALVALVGWGASFYNDAASNQSQYDSVIGQAELKWFLSASPGLAHSTDLGLALSWIALGYTRDFTNSYVGNFFGQDRGYLRFSYFFSGRTLVTLEGGAAAIEYPNMIWTATGDPRHSSFTDVRADATLFGEYRFTDSFGLNATLRYTQNFSNNSLPEFDEGRVLPNPSPAAGSYDMAWNRFEAFLGVRWFL
jgi:hypothetical protein